MRSFLPILSLGFCTLAAAAQPVQDSSLIAYYDFSNNTYDQSGRGNNGIPTEVGYVADGHGNAFSAGFFNGRSSIVRGPLYNSANDLTVSGLVFLNRPQTAPIFYLGNTESSGFGVRLGGQGNRDTGTNLRVLQGGHYDGLSGASMAINTWQHIVMTKSGTTNRISIYVNGVMQGSIGVGQSEIIDAIYIGTEPHGQHNWNDAIDGLIDETRIFSRALNSVEIAALAAADLAGVTQSPQGLISGRLFLDLNANCARDTSDLAMGGRTVMIQPGDLAVPADDSGRFSVRVDANAVYTLRALPELYLHIDSSCHTIADLNSGSSSAYVEVGIQGQACQSLNVQYVTWARRRCFPTTGTVTVSNEGLLPAPATTLHIDYPFGIRTISFSEPTLTSDTAGPEQHFTFSVPALPARGRYTVYLEDITACIDSLRDKILCAKANIEPTAGRCVSSTTGWDGSDLAVLADCGPQPILRFTIHNLGASMADSTTWRVVGEAGIAGSGKFKLAANDSLVIDKVDSAGGAWILEADQRPGHPGADVASVYWYGCGLTMPTRPSPLRLHYLLPDLGPERDEMCLPVTDSFDPNAIVVSPSGIGNAKIVPPGTRLDYRIYFQNEGTANTYFITLQDTLPAALDPATFMRGPESHPGAQTRIYKYNEKYILQYRFPSIALTPKAVNEARSQGFVSYSISPRKQLALGTVVGNRAGIYFDYNPVVLTDAASIVYDHLPVAPGAPAQIVLAARPTLASWLQVYPNPATARVTLTVPTKAGKAQLTVLDGQGRTLHTQTLTQGSATVDMSAFASGIYTLRVTSAFGVETQRVTKL